jgi:di/tricarboxylate transporter
MLDGHDIRIVGLRGAHIRADGRFADVTISVGDVLILTGDHQAVARVLEDAGCLMLAARQEPVPGRITPFAALALAAGIILAATQIASPEIAFALSLLAVAVAGQASLSDLLRRLDWRVVLMLASLIPLAHAFERSGAAAQIAMPIIFVAQGSDLALVAAVWGVTTLITPFLNNVATAAIMAPIALAAGAAAGASPDMLLLAVAAGASTDFLTPFGHHNNTVVMGAGGYELRDFLRQGAPLTLITGVVTIVSLILFF